MATTVLPPSTENRILTPQSLVVDRPALMPERRAPAVNVADTERMISLVGGGLMTLFGLRQGSLGGLCLALAGGALAYRGLTGHCDMYEALGVSTAEPRGAATSVPADRGIKAVRAV